MGWVGKERALGLGFSLGFRFIQGFRLRMKDYSLGLGCCGLGSLRFEVPELRG